jgi:hypothetical protein
MGCGWARLGTDGCLATAKQPPKSPLHERCFTVGTDLRRTRPTRGWLRRSQQVDVDHRQVVGRRLNRVAVVMGLHELAPVSGRATGRRDGSRLERLSQMRQDLRIGPGSRTGSPPQPEVANSVKARDGFALVK